MKKMVEWIIDKDIVVDKNGKMIRPAVGHFEIKKRDFSDITEKMYIEQLEVKEELLKLYEKNLAIATNALKKYQKAIKEFKKDPMNNLVMLSHQVIYDIYMDIQKALKEIDLVGTSVSLPKEEE